MSTCLSNIDALHPDDLAELRRSGLSDETILSMGCSSADADIIREQTGVTRVNTSGYCIPYAGIADQTGKPYVRWRLRQPVEKMRYVSGLGDDPQIYIPPAFMTLVPSDLLIVTEGEKKAAKAVQDGIHCVAVQGVWNWCHPGYRAGEKTEGDLVSEETPPIAKLMKVASKYKRVLVLGDSDLISNHQARRGFELLTRSLSSRGISAGFALCPPGVGHEGNKKKVKKQGIDDWLIANRFLALRSLPALFYAAEINREAISDDYNARVFAELFEDRLAFSQGVWRYWDGSIWVVDDAGKRRRYVPEIANHYRSIAEKLGRLLGRVRADFADLKDENTLAALACWSQPLRNATEILKKASNKICNLSGIDSTLALAQSRVRVPDDVWDRDPHLLQVKNGIVDLRTGEIRPSSPKDWITKCAGASYDPDANCDHFSEFLQQVQPDPEIRDYLQRLVGNCATGLASEQKFFTFVGGGANGKGTFIGLIMDALGNYAVKGPSSILVEQSPDRPRNDLAALAGARLVSISETTENLRLDEATIKAVTGQDVISARFLHREFFQFRPCFTPVLDTNHLPSPRDPGEGMWRRLVIIPWPVTFSEQERNSELREQLLEELPGILSWIIEGAKLYLEGGLPRLRVLTEGNQALRDSCDDLGRFLEACTTSEPQTRIQSSILYGNFRSWNQAEGNDRTISPRTFAQRLRDKGFTSRKIRGVMMWVGIGLRDQEDFDGVQNADDPGPGLAAAPMIAEPPSPTLATTESDVPIPWAPVGMTSTPSGGYII